MIICKKSKINGQFTFNEYVIFFSNILLYSSLFAVFSLNITFFRLLSYCILLSLFYESVWCSLMIYPALFSLNFPWQILIYPYPQPSPPPTPSHKMFYIFLIIQSSKAFYNKSLRFNNLRLSSPVFRIRVGLWLFCLRSPHCAWLLVARVFCKTYPIYFFFLSTLHQ